MEKNINFMIFVTLTCVTTATSREIRGHPENATVLEGGNITLNCIFSTIVSKCTWYTNEVDPVDINGRYEYADKNDNGINTSDCSILINDFKKIDATRWRCSFKQGYDLSPPIISNIAHLQLVTFKRAVVHPQNASIVVGGDVSLKCIFKEVISKCAWFRKHMAVNIRGRYKYHNGIINGINTNDCSIEINQFEEIDATRWQCSCTVDSDSKIKICESNPAYLTKKYLDATTKRKNVTSEISADEARSWFELNSSIFISNSLISILVILILVCVSIYFYRRSRGKKKTDSRSKSSTTDTSQGPSGIDVHQYAYITTQLGTTEEDSLGYLVSKEGPDKGNKPENKQEYNTYEEIPETVV